MLTATWDGALSELNGAIRLIDRVLTGATVDPHNDLAMLSRRLLRAKELFSMLLCTEANEEDVARTIWTRQRQSLTDCDCLAYKADWRSAAVPPKFWDSYIEDARALLTTFSVHERDELGTQPALREKVRN